MILFVSLDVPGPPSHATCIEVFATSIKLSWQPPLKDGGAPISSYIVDKRETSRANWAQVSSKIKGNVLEYNVEKLIEGHEYQFRIRAENMWGVGDPFITSPVIAKNPFSKSLAAFCLGPPISQQRQWQWRNYVNGNRNKTSSSCISSLHCRHLKLFVTQRLTQNSDLVSYFQT